MALAFYWLALKLLIHFYQSVYLYMLLAPFILRSYMGSFSLYSIHSFSQHSPTLVALPILPAWLHPACPLAKTDLYIKY